MIKALTLYTLEQLRQERIEIKKYLKRLDKAIAIECKIRKSKLKLVTNRQKVTKIILDIN